jgi:hypothetical protein
LNYGATFYEHINILSHLDNREGMHMRNWVLCFVILFAGRVFDHDHMERSCIKYIAQEKRLILIARNRQEITDEETCDRLLDDLSQRIESTKLDIHDCNDRKLKKKLIKAKKSYEQFFRCFSNRKESILHEKNSYSPSSSDE